MKGFTWNLVVSANALVIFHILLNIQIESHKHWPWPLVFTPLWVSIIFFTVFLAWYLDDDAVLRLPEIWWLIAGSFSMLVFSIYTIILLPSFLSILLSVKLNDPHSSPSWYGVFTPFWLGLAVFLLVDESWPKYEHKYITRNFELSDIWERYYPVFPKMGLTAFAIYAILHCLHLEQHYYFSWPVIFSPFLVFTGLFQHHRQQWPQRTMHSQKDAKGVVSPAHPSLVSSPTSRRLEEPPNAAAELARLQKEERERRELYEKAQANFNAVVDEAKVEYLRAYRAARETIARCAEDVARAVTQCKEHQERLDEAKKEQATAHEELENVKKAYDLNTGVVWQAERTLVSLKKDEMAKLQMVQALVDWRDSEVSLRTHELTEKEKAKDKVEKPYEMAQAELWKTGEELKRLGVEMQEYDNQNNINNAA